MDEWYRSDGWSPEDRREFERRLARTRGFSRAQYLRIKALALLSAVDDERRAAGAELMGRVLAEHPEQTSEVGAAHFALGEYCEQTGDVPAAIGHYEAALVAESTSRAFHGTPLLLAELIVRHDLVDRYAQANRLLDRVVAERPLFPDRWFRYAVTRARLAARIGSVDEAAAFADAALDLLTHNGPVLARLPEVGLIRADEHTVRELQSMARTGNPAAFSGLVDRDRGPDGRIHWTVELIRRLRHGGTDAATAADRYAEDAAPIIDDLRAAGFEVYDLEAFASRRLATAADVHRAAGVFAPWLRRCPNPRVQATIAAALADRRARKIAFDALVVVFTELRHPGIAGGEDPSIGLGALRGLKDRLAFALGTVATGADFDTLATLIRDPAHGHYRGYLFTGIARAKTTDAVDLCLEMVDDPELGTGALRALATLNSEQARPVLERIAGETPVSDDRDARELTKLRATLATRALTKLNQ